MYKSVNMGGGADNQLVRTLIKVALDCNSNATFIFCLRDASEADFPTFLR